MCSHGLNIVGNTWRYDTLKTLYTQRSMCSHCNITHRVNQSTLLHEVDWFMHYCWKRGKYEGKIVNKNTNRVILTSTWTYLMSLEPICTAFLWPVKHAILHAQHVTGVLRLLFTLVWLLLLLLPLVVVLPGVGAAQQAVVHDFRHTEDAAAQQEPQEASDVTCNTTTTHR